MKSTVATFLVAIMSLAGLAAWGDDALSEVLYGATFEDYQPGDTLSDVGAVGGSWGTPAVPSGMDAVAVEKSDGSMYMSCYTTSTDRDVATSTGIAFVPENADLRSKQSVEVSVLSDVCDELPDVPEGVKTGFTVYAPGGGDEVSLVAWVGCMKSWTNLYLQAGIELPSEQWYEVRTKFVKRDDGRLLAQYAVKIKGTYLVLRTQDNAAWIDLGTVGRGALVRRVEIRGDGGLEYLNGSKPAQGLYVGVGRWYTVMGFDTASTNEYGMGTWQKGFDGKRGNAPKINDKFHAYELDMTSVEDPYVFAATKRRTASEAVEVSVRFVSTSRDESIPDDNTCARMRIIAEPDMTDMQPDPVYRFACLVNDGGSWAWKTNTAVVASIEKDYVVQILLDSDKGNVTYRVKEGIGYDSGEYVTLFEITGLSAEAFGTYTDVYFEGSGLVYEVKETDRTSNE